MEAKIAQLIDAIRATSSTSAFDELKRGLSSLGLRLETLSNLSKEVYQAYEAGFDDGTKQNQEPQL